MDSSHSLDTMARTTLGPAVDIAGLLKDWHMPPGERKDGIYETPGQHYYDGMYFPGLTIPSELDRIKNSLEFNEQDVITSGYPKAGSTWVNELIFLICNGADVEYAAKVPTLQKLPFVEFNFDPKVPSVDAIQKMASPRLIKSHLPPTYYQRNFDKREKGPKIIISMRNPKDALVSYYHFYRMSPGFGPFDGDWNEFFELFRQKKLHYGDIVDVNASWWRLKDHPNIYIVKYEDLKKDAANEVRKMAVFLGHTFNDDQVGAIVEATTFENMKKNASHSDFGDQSDPDKTFFRKGKVGGWRAHFSDEQSAYIDALCAEKYAPIGLTFDY